ncbi:macro domain containing protein [Pseudohyphozyma bogoriensis]|nr:macro domain containing protein [Pseudohyphozyma bogoriensis]
MSSKRAADDDEATESGSPIKKPSLAQDDIVVDVAPDIAVDGLDEGAGPGTGGASPALALDTSMTGSPLPPFPSDEPLPELARPELETLPEQDILLPPIRPLSPSPFPSDQQLEQEDLPVPQIPTPRDLDEDIIFQNDIELRRSMSPASEYADSDASGVDPASLRNIRQMYEHELLKPIEDEGGSFPYSKAYNERIVVWRGDITTLAVDAIVNAANSSLMGGGGVDGAIHSAAGPGLKDECRTLNGAETGETKITGGHRLPSKHILHTVGPIYPSSQKTKCEKQLRSCYESCLKLAVENGCKTLAFSGISTGIYGYPLDDATRTALDVVRNFLATPEADVLEKIIFTVFRPIDVQSYVSIIPEVFPPPPAPELTTEAVDIVPPPQESEEDTSRTTATAILDKTLRGPVEEKDAIEADAGGSEEAAQKKAAEVEDKLPPAVSSTVDGEEMADGTSAAGAKREEERNK